MMIQVFIEINIFNLKEFFSKIKAKIVKLY
jgi:hypothetical protein